MNIGSGELVVVLLNVILILAIPAFVVIFVILLFRRIRDLEVRVAKLEGKQDSTSERPVKTS